MGEADINFRPLHTFIVDIDTLFEPLVCCLKGKWEDPYNATSTMLATDLCMQGHLWSEKMLEAVIHLRPLHTSIVDIHKVFEPLICCLKGIWVHPCTATLTMLAPDLCIQGHLWSENDAIASWLRLISTSDCFIHPQSTYTKCLSHC